MHGVLMKENLINFFLNNILTYRDRQKKGLQAIKALLFFYITCGLGAIANVGVANYLYMGKINEISFELVLFQVS